MAILLEAEVNKAATSQTSYSTFLQRLVEEELAVKADRSINARIAKARFRMVRTLECQPQLPIPRIKELAQLDFLDRAENVVAVGPPGTGKSHLIIAWGLNRKS